MRFARSISACSSFGAMAPTTLAVTWSCRSKMSSQLAFEAVGPQMRPGRGIDELAGDAHAVAGLAHAAFQHVAHAQARGPTCFTSTARPL